MLHQSKLTVCLVMVLTFCLLFAPVASVSCQGVAPEKVLDNELVVTQLDDNGQIKDIKVLNHLRIFGTGNYTFEDQSNYQLSSIRNLYSNDSIEKQDGKIKVSTSLSADQQYNDIYYLATLDKKEISKVNMPVDIKVEYYLDGKKVKPSELTGKNGHLKIVCYLENKTGEKKVLEFTDSNGQLVKKEAEVYTPYVVSLSGWEFSNKKFSNIKAPGKAGESPEGVLVNAQGVTSVTWSVPMIPPKYPAKQYTVLEADGRDIELKSFKIAVIPILPTSSEVDSLGTVQESLAMLYDGFDQIQSGVGSKNQDATLLFGLNAVKEGMQQVSGGLGTLVGKVKQLRFGLSNPAFDAASYDTLKGTDANGNTPGAKDAVGLIKTTVDEKLVPALGAQKMVLGLMETAIGTSADKGQVPSASTSLYNDVNYLKDALAGTPAQKVITDAIEPKLTAMGHNVAVFRDGGEMITSSGSVPFPASVTALELGANLLSSSLDKVNSGLGLMVLGLGDVGKNGQPVVAMADGKPATLLYALSYLQAGIDGKLIPGVIKLQEGTGKIGSGAGEAKEAIANGLQTFESVGAIVSALDENASKADTFLGKAAGAQGTVAYVYQTPEVSKQADAMKYGLGAIVVALILLLAIGRPPKDVFQATTQENA